MHIQIDKQKNRQKRMQPNKHKIIVNRVYYSISLYDIDLKITEIGHLEFPENKKNVVKMFNKILHFQKFAS